MNAWWTVDAAFLVLRVVAALLMIQLGVQTLFGVLLPAGHRFAGTPALLSDEWVVAALQLGAGVLLIVGLFTQLASTVLALLTVFNFVTERTPAEFWPITSSGTGAVLLLCLFTTFVIAGPGLFSVDAFLSIRRRPRVPTTTVPMSPWIKGQYRRRTLTR